MTLTTCGLIDTEIREVVDLLRGRGVDTFSSCSGKPGHSWSYPMVRCHPCNPARLFNALLDFGYNGFYVKEYRSAHKGASVDFIEIEFWSPDCLNRKKVDV